MKSPEIFERLSSNRKIISKISYTAAMPCLLNDNYIDQTIECLFKQETKDLVYSIIIVISNCNNNHLSKNILKKIENFFYKYNVSIKVFLFSKRLNGSQARNYCFKNANSDFIGLCDSDDNWKPYKVYKEMISITSSQRRINTQFIGSISQKRIFKNVVFKLPIQVKHCLLLRKQFPHTSTWVLSKYLYSNISFDNKLERYQDLAFILKARNLCKECLIINENLVDIRRSISRKKIKLQSFIFSLKFCKDYLDNNLINSTLFIFKYFLYPRIRYFYVNK